jgi:acetoin utilization deacetylase AcuC-like enzyme
VSLSRIQSFYGTNYCPNDGNKMHFERLRQLHVLLQVQPHWQWCEPEAISQSELLQVHDAGYVDAMLHGIQPLCNSAYLPWSTELLAASRAMLGGQLMAADAALAEGIAMNLAIGFHHAHPARGGGFCVFNGLAAVAILRPHLRVVVLDCDEHGGDGTAAFASVTRNLTNISIFGTRFGVQTSASTLALKVPKSTSPGRDYLNTLDQALDRILALAPDLVLFQAGADMHELDPQSTLRISSEILAKRDEIVFSTLRAANLSVLCSFAGGYQSPERTAALYLQTTQQMARVYLAPADATLLGTTQ